MATRKQIARASKRAMAKPGGSLYSLSEGETYEMGRALGQRLAPGDLVLLEGPLGAGKTVLARGIAAGLGLPPEDVCSPSFTLVQEYRNERVTMYHVDLYRIDDPGQIDTLGLEELLTANAVVVVEWGERVPRAYRRDAIVVRLRDIGEASRRIDLATDASPELGTANDH